MSVDLRDVMDKSMVAEINRLRGLTVGQLRDEWFRLYGEPTTSRHREYLWRRLAWRIQELQQGGLSTRAKERAAALAPDLFARSRTPRLSTPVVNLPNPTSAPAKTIRDTRLPVPGTVLTRQWHGREIRVVVHADGFEWDGRRFGSLSALARTVTGQRWNGRLWMGLTQRVRGK